MNSALCPQRESHPTLSFSRLPTYATNLMLNTSCLLLLLTSFLLLALPSQERKPGSHNLPHFFFPVTTAFCSSSPCLTSQPCSIQGHTESFPRSLRLKATDNVLLPGSLSFQSSTQVTCSSRVSPKAHGAKIQHMQQNPSRKAICSLGYNKFLQGIHSR